MMVRTYRWRSSYAGQCVAVLCRSCGGQLEATRKESTFGHADLWATVDDGEREGTCESHAERQRSIDRIGVNMGSSS
jgi:hypothetical protein